ncbi:MAG: TonB family protein [Porphyrobacter sp.]|nr:TonB family protein [Porphyrobacter sp.]
MRARLPVLGLALALTAPLSAAQTAPPPPAFVTVRQAEKALVSWQAGAVRCGGEEGVTIAPLDPVEPMPSPVAIFAGAERAGVTLLFDLDAEGRPFAIRRQSEARVIVDEQDLIPALRASRFAVAAPQTGCSVTYSPRVEPLSEAPLAKLARYGVGQRARLDPATWDRFAPGNCRERPRVAPLLRAYPDWRKLERRAGEWGWTYVGYDIDAEGVPVNLETLAGSGDPGFDEEGRRAVAAARYAGGPRSGCVQVWWRGPAKIPAPPIPPKSETEGNPACEIDDRWATEPRLTYPRPYENRAVEGWAILRYDVAPWGEIGAIEVLDAQPSAEFGQAAVGVIRRSRYKPLESGLSGCVDRVIFRIRPDADEASDGESAPEPG